jgi:hypothetical protein
MDRLLIVSGVIGIFCAVASLITMAIAMSQKGNWPMVLGCLGSLAVVLFLTLLSIEYADDFWKGRL